MQNRFEYLRDRNNLYKADVARALKVSRTSYCDWENGKENIPTRRLIQLANFYQVNIDYLLGLTDIKITIKPVPLNKELIAKRTKEVRAELKMTLREIAQLLNTTSSTWSAYETGKTIILEPFIITVCQKTGISADYLLDRSNTKYTS